MQNRNKSILTSIKIWKLKMDQLQENLNIVNYHLSIKQMTFENLVTILRNNPNEILLNNLTLLKNIHSELSPMTLFQLKHTIPIKILILPYQVFKLFYKISHTKAT